MTDTQPRARYWRWLRDIFLVLVVVFGVQWWQSRDLPLGAAPSLAGADLQGQPLALLNQQGKPVLVHFWATWCPICRLEEGSIASIAEDHAVLTVATNSGSAEEVAAYLKEQGVDFPVILDESGDLARRWNVHGVPASFVINDEGDIDYAAVGYSTELGLRARLFLAR